MATAIPIGVVAGLMLAVFAPWQLAILAGWDVAAAIVVIWVWLAVGQFDASETAEYAKREDSSRALADTLLISASLIALIGVGLDLVKSSQAWGPGKFALTAIAVLTVAGSWGLVHTVYLLRYAYRYYAEPVGGVDFNSDDGPPDYHDFAYLAFTIGMTFQVSDTDLQQRTIRRLALQHALLAYLFGAVIVATTVNVIAGIVQ